MPLKITSLDPSAVKAGWEGSLIVNGVDLGEAGFIAIDGKSPTIDFWRATQIKSQVTKAITEKPGRKRLVVHDEGGNFDETEWTVEDA